MLRKPSCGAGAGTDNRPPCSPRPGPHHRRRRSPRPGCCPGPLPWPTVTLTVPAMPRRVHTAPPLDSKAAERQRDGRHRQRLGPALRRVVEHHRRRVDARGLKRRGGHHLDLAANVLQRGHQSSKRRLITVAASYIRSGSFWSRKSLNHVTGADTTRCWPPQLGGRLTPRAIGWE